MMRSNEEYFGYIPHGTGSGSDLVDSELSDGCALGSVGPSLRSGENRQLRSRYCACGGGSQGRYRSRFCRVSDARRPRFQHWKNSWIGFLTHR